MRVKALSRFLSITRRLSTFLNAVLLGFSVLALIFYLLEFGGDLPAWGPSALSTLRAGLWALFLCDMVLQFVVSRPKVLFFRDHFIDWIILIPWILTGGLTYSVPLIWVRQSIWVWQVFFWARKTMAFLSDFRRHPGKMLASSFFVLISIGTVLLVLPISVREGGETHLIDALFTATSAACVTGLTVLDTFSHFSPFGQGVILSLIQVGGLGMMTLSSAVAVILGEKLTVQNQTLLQDILQETNVEDFRRLLITIVRMTLVIETIGAVVLAANWKEKLGSWGKAFYFGVFHSISAFCHAGFALFPDSLVGFSSDWITTLTITGLILIGGIGFPVMAGILYSRFWSRDPARRHPLSVHTKLALVVTIVLLLVGTTFLFFVEFSNSFENMNLSTRLQVAWFQSVTARTAGFATVPMNTLTASSLFLMMVLMFIGAAPGSPGGGIKTTTFGVLGLAFVAMLRGREDVECFGRRISPSIINKSVAITMLAVGLITVAVLILLMTERPYPLMTILFEVVSAAGTVGLSLGLTPYLSVLGKFVVTVLMFVGRIGPLTLAFIVGQQVSAAQYRYPYGKVIVG